MSEVVVVEWSTITVDVKEFIVGFLDYESRCNLRTCSKSDLALVDSTKFKPDTISIVETVGFMNYEKTIIRLKIDSFTIWFIGKNDVTQVDRAWSGQMSARSERKRENRYDVMRRHVDRFFANGLIAAREISILDCKLHPSENWKLQCSHLKLEGHLNEEHVHWLNQSVREFRRLVVSPSLGGSMRITSDLLEVSQSLRLLCDTDMTVEQLESAKAVDIDVSSPHVTTEAVKTFLAKFLKNGKREDCMYFRIPHPGDFDFANLLAKSVKFRRMTSRDRWYLFDARITGGFENVHGVQDARSIYVSAVGDDRVSINCHVLEKNTIPCVLWPFTDN